MLRRLHGECYGDASALRADLIWLEANGFCSAEPSLAPLKIPPHPVAGPQPDGQPGPDCRSEPPELRPWLGGVHGGFPPLADRQVFERVFVLLRYLLQHPFERQSGTPPCQST